MGQLEDWFKSWVPSTVHSAGGGRSSVDAWFSSGLDFEECLSGGVDSDVHLFVADVVKSFDTVDRGVLDRVLSSLGLPAWFRHAYFLYHAGVRLRFKLAVGLEESWTRDGGIPQGCPLSMMFIVALYLPWCRYLDQLPDVSPQLYADNLKCVSSRPEQLLRAAQFTSAYVRLVGQEPAPSKCVLMSTSAAIRRNMKDWVFFLRVNAGLLSWKFEILEGILTLLTGPGDAPLLQGFLLFFGLSGLSLLYRLVIVVGFVFFGPCMSLLLCMGLKHLISLRVVFFKLRAAFVRDCWSSKLTLARTGTVFGMLDGPEYVDPVACIVWFRFRLMRRYLAYRPFETAWIGRLLELVSGGAPGHEPVHFLVESASSLGFQWCLGGFCWNRPGLPQLPMVEGPYQHFQDSILGALRDLNAADLCKRKGFRGARFWILEDPCSSLTLPC